MGAPKFDTTRRCEIVKEYEQLIQSGKQRGKAEIKLAEKWTTTDRTIRRIVSEHYARLAGYAKNNLETQVIQTYSKLKDFKLVANTLEMPLESVTGAFDRVSSLAALQGYAPAQKMVHDVPMTHFVKGVSTMYDGEGNVRAQWVKSDTRKQDEIQTILKALEALKETMPQVVTEAPTVDFDKDVMVAIPFGDPHLGQFSWREETGADFDLKIAEKDLCAAVDRLVHATPPAAECLIANLGDFFHADNMDAETWRSKHKLDVDSRWLKVLQVGIKAMRRCIDTAAARHQKVTVINAIGNHDDHSSMMLSVTLSHIYENDPRINIINRPTKLHTYRYGKVLVAVTHGDSIKMQNLPLTVAAEYPKEWGETVYRYGLTGHIHHDSKVGLKEHNGMVVESFRTLAARDAWAASKGYSSGRDMKAIIYHRNFGEIGRHIVSVAMLNAGK